MSTCLGYGSLLFGQTLVETVSFSLCLSLPFSFLPTPVIFIISCTILVSLSWSGSLLYYLDFLPHYHALPFPILLASFPSTLHCIEIFLHPSKNTLIILLLLSLWQPWLSLFSCQVLLLNCVGAQCCDNSWTWVWFHVRESHAFASWLTP